MTFSSTTACSLIAKKEGAAMISPLFALFGLLLMAACSLVAK